MLTLNLRLKPQTPPLIKTKIFDYNNGITKQNYCLVSLMAENIDRHSKNKLWLLQYTKWKSIGNDAIFLHLTYFANT